MTNAKLSSENLIIKVCSAFVNEYAFKMQHEMQHLFERKEKQVTHKLWRLLWSNYSIQNEEKITNLI